MLDPPSDGLIALEREFELAFSRFEAAWEGVELRLNDEFYEDCKTARYLKAWRAGVRPEGYHVDQVLFGTRMWSDDDVAAMEPSS